MKRDEILLRQRPTFKFLEYGFIFYEAKELDGI